MCLDAFKETLVEGLGTRNVFTIPLLGGIPVAESVVVSWLIMAALMIATLLLTRRLRVRDPGKVQIGLESAVEFLNGFVKTNIGRHWRPFAPYLGTVLPLQGGAGPCHGPFEGPAIKMRFAEK